MNNIHNSFVLMFWDHVTLNKCSINVTVITFWLFIIITMNFLVKRQSSENVGFKLGVSWCSNKQIILWTIYLEWLLRCDARNHLKAKKKKKQRRRKNKEKEKKKKKPHTSPLKKVNDTNSSKMTKCCFSQIIFFHKRM